MKTSQKGIDLIKSYAVIGSADGCWIFKNKSFVTSKGGRMRYGIIMHNKKKWRAHRLAAALAGMEVKPRDVVCHTCDNPMCLNPAHLFVGTQADNIADMNKKGRQRAPRGESHVHATVSDATVEAIRQRALAGENQRLLAIEYGVSQPLVSMIKHGKTRASHENV